MTRQVVSWIHCSVSEEILDTLPVKYSMVNLTSRSVGPVHCTVNRTNVSSI